MGFRISESITFFPLMETYRVERTREMTPGSISVELSRVLAARSGFSCTKIAQSGHALQAFLVIAHAFPFLASSVNARINLLNLWS